MSKYDLIKFIETVTFAFSLTPEQEHKLVKKAITYCCDETILKEKQLKYKSISQTCKAILKTGKNKGQYCSHQVHSDGYCKRHSKCAHEEKKEENKVKPKPLRETDIVLRKNKFGNIVYPGTNLILDKDNSVIAKETKTGEWESLTEIDIEVCKKHKLRYKIMDLTFKGEINPIKVKKF